MEGRIPEEHASIRDEGDVEGSYHSKAICYFSNEREEAPLQVAAPILGEHKLCILGQGELVSG